MEGRVHVELFEAGGAEGVAAVDHDAGEVAMRVVLLLAEGTPVLVQQLAHELVDFFAEEVGGVLGLLEEEGCRVLQFLHLI